MEGQERVLWFPLDANGMKRLLSLSSKPVVRTRAEIADTIQSFVDGTGGPWDWDDFICGGSIEDPTLEAIRDRCASLSQEFPPLQPGHYCSDAGVEVMRGFIRRLRAEA